MDPAAIAAATAALDAAYEAVRAVWNKAAAAAGRCKAARKLPWCQERTVTGLRWPYDFTQASCPQPALRSPGHRGFVAHTYGPAVSGGSSACRSLLMPLSLQRLRCALCCERRHCSRHPLASTPCVPPLQVYDTACELDERPFAAAAAAGGAAGLASTPAALPGLLPGATPPTLSRCTVGTPGRGVGCARRTSLRRAALLLYARRSSRTACPAALQWRGAKCGHSPLVCRKRATGIAHEAWPAACCPARNRAHAVRFLHVTEPWSLPKKKKRREQGRGAGAQGGRAAGHAAAAATVAAAAGRRRRAAHAVAGAPERGQLLRDARRRRGRHAHQRVARVHRLAARPGGAHA